MTTPTSDKADEGIAGGSRSVTRALTLLETVALQAQSPLRLADIVSMSGLPKTTSHRLLGVLCGHGLLSVDEDGRYRPGALLLAMGTNFLRQTDLRDVALPSMQRLTEVTQETSHLGLLQFPWVVYVAKVESPQAVRMHSQVGAVNPLYCTGLGKALLAFSPQPLIDQVCAGPLPRRTDKTLTTSKALLKDLALIRERGYSIDDVENEPGIRCVGAPILNHEGKASAAISVAGPETRITMKDAPRIGNLVVTIASEISRSLGFADAPA
jgi:IclR family acetate operon transcriptional repressor